MAIRFTCQCGQELQAREEHAGRKTRCPQCGAEPVIPGGTEESVQAEREPRPGAGREFAEEDEKIQSRRDAPPRGGRRQSAYEDNDEERRERPGPSGTSGKAWASLILGLSSWVGCTLITGIPAVLFGIWSLANISGSQGRLKGKGLAITGIVLGALGSLLIGPAVLIALLLPAVQKVREAGARVTSSNNLKQIDIALLNYNDVYGGLPPGNFKVAGPGAPATANYGNPGLSWRVALLPFIEQDALYRQFHLDEPWDSPHNKTLLTQIPKVYQHPNGDANKTAAGFTYYRAFVGPGTAFDPTAGRIQIPGHFTDGTAQTLLVVEAADPIEWTRPETADFEYAPNKPLPKLGNFWSSGSAAGMADGSVHVLKKDISEATLRALITRNGNDVVGPDF